MIGLMVLVIPFVCCYHICFSNKYDVEESDDETDEEAKSHKHHKSQSSASSWTIPMGRRFVN